jgi:hypothetical protein
MPILRRKDLLRKGRCGTNIASVKNKNTIVPSAVRQNALTLLATLEAN